MIRADDVWDLGTQIEEMIKEMVILIGAVSTLKIIQYTASCDDMSDISERECFLQLKSLHARIQKSKEELDDIHVALSNLWVYIDSNKNS